MSDATGHRKDKHLVLDQAKLRKAQKILGGRSESETVERALDFVINEDVRSQRVWAAHERFLKAALREGLLIHDVFGRLGDEDARKGVS
jgi:hypothetical protein